MLIQKLDSEVTELLPKLGEHLVRCSTPGDGVTNVQLTMFLTTSDGSTVNFRVEGEQMYWNSDHSVPRGMSASVSSGGAVYIGRSTTHVFFDNKYKLKKIVMNASTFDAGTIEDLLFDSEISEVEIYGKILSDISVFARCENISKIALRDARGDIESWKNLESLSRINILGCSGIHGDIANLNNESMVSIEINGTGIGGNIEDLGNCTALTRLTATGSLVTGSVENMAQSMFDNGARNHTCNVVLANGGVYLITFTDDDFTVTVPNG